MQDEQGVRVAAEGDVVLLLSPDRKRYLVRLRADEMLHTHKGYIPHAALIGEPLGRIVPTHTGRRFLVLEPSLDDLVRMIKRTTQIMYPKDIGYILMKMSLGPGKRVVEAGTGSGGLTLALASFVRPTGRVYSYDCREDVLHLARKNLDVVGLVDFVELKHRDIAEGFDEREVDACFLDVRTPWSYLGQVAEVLKGGGFFGCILPTANQVSRLLAEMPLYHLLFPEVEEIVVRPYKATPARLRPADRMVAHTGYLVFARKVEADLEQLEDKDSGAADLHNEDPLADPSVRA